MSDAADSEQNKSEQPTPYKLSKAREKGAVARGMDLGFLTSLAAFLAYSWIMGPGVQTQVARMARAAFVTAPQAAGGSSEILALTGTVMAAAARPLAFMMAVIFGVVLVFEIAQTGVVFSTEPLRMDFGKLSPAKGFKRVFSFRMLVETGKNVLKLAAYTAVAAFVILEAQRNAPAIANAADLAAALTRTGLRFLMFFTATALVFAALDQLISRRDFMKRMRMSRREIRRETRDREGEPRLKQKRKQMHREFTKQSQSLRGIKDADVLITNPTHFAVALKYDPRQMIAPMVVSQGAHGLAQRLKRLAFLYGVVIVEDRQLARELYAKAILGAPIPEIHYRRVADLYRSLGRRRQGQTVTATGADV